MRPAELARSLVLAAIHVGMGFVWLSLVSLGVDRMRGLIERRRLQVKLEAVAGAVLIGLGVRLAMERR